MSTRKRLERLRDACMTELRRVEPRAGEWEISQRSVVLRARGHRVDVFAEGQTEEEALKELLDKLIATEAVQ